MSILEQIVQYFGYGMVGFCVVVILIEFVKVFIMGNKKDTKKKDPKSLHGH